MDIAETIGLLVNSSQVLQTPDDIVVQLSALLNEHTSNLEDLIIEGYAIRFAEQLRHSLE